MVPTVAPKLHLEERRRGVAVFAPGGKAGSGSPMTRDFQIRFFAVLLALVTVAAGTFAWINYQKEREYEAPYDGVWWVERPTALEAQRVDAQGPAARAGIRAG